MKKSVGLTIIGAGLGIAATIVNLVGGKVSKAEKEEKDREELRKFAEEYLSKHSLESGSDT